jgi:hypothetical protein
MVAAIISIEALSATDSIGMFRNCSNRARSAAVIEVSSGSTVYFTHTPKEIASWAGESNHGTAKNWHVLRQFA